MAIIKIKTCYAGPNPGAEGYGLEAQTACGRRFMHRHTWRSSTKADARAFDVACAGSINDEHWIEGFPVYGSPASEAEQAEAALYAYALSRGDIAEADVPDCFRTLI